MGKRSNFLRKKNEAYDTPYSAVVPLLRFLPAACYFIEPCAGKGKLIDALTRHGHTCVYACDIEPRRDDIVKNSAYRIRRRPGSAKPRFITNPPFIDEWLFPLLRHLCPQGEVWLLLPMDKLANDNMKVFLHQWCRDVVTIGRVSWEENGTSSKENFAWFRFDGTVPPGPITFHPRPI